MIIGRLCSNRLWAGVSLAARSHLRPIQLYSRPNKARMITTSRINPIPPLG